MSRSGKTRRVAGALGARTAVRADQTPPSRRAMGEAQCVVGSRRGPYGRVAAPRGGDGGSDCPRRSLAPPAPCAAPSMHSADDVAGRRRDWLLAVMAPRRSKGARPPRRVRASRGGRSRSTPPPTPCSRATRASSRGPSWRLRGRRRRPSRTTASRASAWSRPRPASAGGADAARRGGAGWRQRRPAAVPGPAGSARRAAALTSRAVIGTRS